MVDEYGEENEPQTDQEKRKTRMMCWCGGWSVCVCLALEVEDLHYGNYA